MSGTFMVSLDLELFWGMLDVCPLEEYQDNVLGGKKAIPQLLKLFEKYGIHATWAAVGFLFADTHEELSGFLPKLRPGYANRLLDGYAWFDKIGENEETAPCFYAPGLLQEIAATPGQEIGSHTFCHYYCREEGQTLEEFEEDMCAAKAIAAAIKGLVAAIAAGGWVAVVIIVVICLIGALIACFGIFFSSEDTGSAKTMQMVVQEVNQEYQDQLDSIKSSVTYDTLEMSGSMAVWPEVLSVYSVKVTSDPDNPQEVATITDEKEQILRDIFWEMNEISYTTSTEEVTEIIETDDGEGNIIDEEIVVTKTTLHITVTHKTADEMASQYSFNTDQQEHLDALLEEGTASMWASVLYGVYGEDDQIVAVAISQIGNVGGMPYWSWYGFGSRVAWCACFVSWCANECGYIDIGVIPKFAGCVNGVNWFKARGQWADGSFEPAPGMIIFFDWDSPNGESGPQDGLSDHVGIVEKVENGRVYTIEGNTSDSCARRSYPLGYYEILGYGIPAY
jgi:peptidoglycan/xylan/chitin deacetylase (PgdA/CDA1 family)